VAAKRKGQKKPGKAEQMGKQVVYQIKVTLRDAHPPIWRRILVTGDITLARLHHILQSVMPWEAYHLHEFEVRGGLFGVPEPGPQLYDRGVHDETKTRLIQLALGRGTKFTYEYDFGDCWEHDLLVEEVLEPEPGVRYPCCTGGERAAPPEDVGGVWGYERCLEALANPQDPEHELYRDWFPDSLDPEAFDLEETNEALKWLTDSRRGGKR